MSQCAPRSPKCAGSFTCCRSPFCSSTSHTFTHAGHSCRAVQTRLEMSVQCPPLIPLAPWHRDAPQDGSCHPSTPWTRASSLFSLCSSLHTPGTRWQEPGLTERGRFPGSEQPCRSPLLLARRRDRGGDFTNSSGIRLPKQSCGAQDDDKSTSPPLKGFASQEPGSDKKCERVKSPKGTNQQRMLSCKVSS